MPTTPTTKKNGNRKGLESNSSDAADVDEIVLKQESSPMCRICHGGLNEAKLISPCACTGTLSFIHRECLERWLGQSNTDKCELCCQTYPIERRPRPFSEWLRGPARRNDSRNLLGDTICFIVLSPMVAISLYLCMAGALHFLRYKEKHWETIALMTLVTIVVSIYLSWCMLALRYHYSIWINWRENNQMVRVLVPSETSEENSIDHLRTSVISPKEYSSAPHLNSPITTVI